MAALSKGEISIKNMRHIPVDDIDVAEENVRKTQAEAGLDTLQRSIEKFGLIQPVVVIPNGGRYSLIVGQRRLLAFRRLGRKTIPALVADRMEPNLRMMVSFWENILRRRLPYEDTVELCNALFERHSGSKLDRIRKISDDLGVSQATAATYLAHRLVPDKVRKMVSDGSLPMDIAYRISSAHFPNTDKITAIAGHAAKLTREERRRAAEFGSENPDADVRSIISHAKNPPPTVKLIIHIEQGLSERLNKLSRKKNTDVAGIVKHAIGRYLEEG